jgi:hypothetical protein
MRYIRFVPYRDLEEALRKVERHQLDLLVEIGPPTRYWINPTAPKGYFVEFALLQATAPRNNTIVKEQIAGDPRHEHDVQLPVRRRLCRRPISKKRLPETLASDTAEFP